MLRFFLAFCLLSFLTNCAPMAIGAATTTAGIAIAQERTVGDAVDDATIKLEIMHHYIQEDVNELLTSVKVRVTQGRVLLTGNVKEEESRLSAVRLAWKPRGVKEVINEIQVKNDRAPKEVGKDLWITAQVKSKLLLNKGVRSINYTILTNNQTVYVFGVARSKRELDTVTRIASMVKGVKKVVSHASSLTKPNVIY